MKALDKKEAQQLGLNNKGIIISQVAPRSPASQVGLQTGQVILSVNRKNISSMNTLQRAMKSSGNTILLQVRTSQVVRFVVLSK